MVGNRGLRKSNPGLGIDLGWITKNTEINNWKVYLGFAIVDDDALLIKCNHICCMRWCDHEKTLITHTCFHMNDVILLHDGLNEGYTALKISKNALWWMLHGCKDAWLIAWMNGSNYVDKISLYRGI